MWDASHVWTALGSAMAWYVYSALIQALPEPLPLERWYGFLYKFLHLLGANFQQLKGGK